MANLNKSYIYKVTNLLNGKMYVGQHDGSKPAYYASGTVVKRAIRKHGKHSFAREILVEGFFSKEELDALEVEYIEKFHTYAYDYPETGYNYTRGGAGKRGHKPTPETLLKIKLNSANRRGAVQLTLEGDYVATHLSTVDAAAAVGRVQPSGITRCCQGTAWVAGGFRWAWADTYDAEKPLPAIRNIKKAVGQYNEADELVQVFPSAGDAAKCFGVSRAFIANVICGNAKRAVGYKWKLMPAVFL